MWFRKPKQKTSESRDPALQGLPIKLTELDLGFHSDVGAPCPVVLSDEHRVLLLYYTQDPPDPSWDGTTIHVRNAAQDTGVALITFDCYDSFYFGMPNDEALSGHRYYTLGLRAYSEYEVLNSEWIRQQETMNRVHPHHSAKLFEDQRHFLFTFHDSCFEIIARSITWKMLGCSLQDALSQSAEYLNAR